MVDYFLKLTEKEAELLERMLRAEKEHMEGQGTPAEERIYNMHRKIERELKRPRLERKIDEVEIDA